MAAWDVKISNIFLFCKVEVIECIYFKGKCKFIEIWKKAPVAKSKNACYLKIYLG